MKIERTVTVTIPGVLTLRALRELVTNTQDLPAEGRVDMRYNSDQREGQSWTTVTIK